MKHFTAILTAMALVAASAAEEFWISAESRSFLEGIKFTKHYPQCTKELHAAKLWRFSLDVSGDKQGVRMVGNIDDPSILEFNTGDDFLGHNSECILYNISPTFTITLTYQNVC